MGLRRLSVSLRRTVPPSGFWIWSASGPAGGFEGSQSSKKVLWAKSKRERGFRKLPVRGVDSEVVGIGCLHKANQAVQIRRTWDDGSAPGTCETNSAASMPSFVLSDEFRFAKDQHGGVRRQSCPVRQGLSSQINLNDTAPPKPRPSHQSNDTAPTERSQTRTQAQK